MGDFFYYGQKDTIQRLNELAGRGAVVASYAPAVGRSPLGGPNGYIDAAWIDTATPIKSQFPISVGAGMANKYGYNYLQGGQGQRLYKIATLEPTVSSTYSSLRIDAMVGGWGAYDLTAMTIIIGSRVATAAEGVNVEWSSSRFIPVNVRFLAYLESDGKVSVYLFFLAGGFAQASFQLMGMQITTYTSPVAVDTVTGTPVWDSSASPSEPLYRSPRSRGMGNAPTTLQGTSFDSIVEVRAQDGNTSSVSYLAGAPKAHSMAAKQEAEALRIGVSANTGISYAGFFNAVVSVGENASPFALGYKLALKARDVGSGNFTPTLFSITGNGTVYVPLLKAGSSDPSLLRHSICRGTGQGAEIIYFGVDNAPAPSVAILASEGVGSWSAPVAVLYIGKNSTTGRSVSAGGTVNTSGNDYAEYIFKSPACGVVSPGQIVGITADNKVTDQWADAVMFSIKSTAPSFVGGDSWANDIGQRPSPQAGPAPTQPLRREDVVTQHPVPGTNPPEYEDVVTEPGDTDDEWAQKQATYTAALAAYNIAVQQDAEAMAAFDAALEVERQKVDRIAIAGRVPVNVLGTLPGDYIVPVQDGAGIKGIAVHEDDLSMKQYLHAVGRVISIEPDGRAYVMVKAV
ncbi:hypothetical protein [Janthinobacterium kumbetense]|uniref:Tip attachment protein J domain-containing protein n=1 Tax=Janthinobacterium kumbetense TaxID=2950280 RepID=A0ABT0WJI3_9BURK|nr:hypothetical protein [Janthinobacterium kumbetense]MCM2564219.1 hypothetical protein [Janthinobacterium kumbetense]